MRLSTLTVTVFMCFPAWVSSASAADIYQWIDNAGVVHFSDTRPAGGAVVTTLTVSETNPPDYDPAADPYSIRNQAERTSAIWTTLKNARAERRQRQREQAERDAPATPPYQPNDFSPAVYLAPFHPASHRSHDPRLARRQLRALDELELTGPRPHSINSGAHHARVLKSRNLPTVIPGPGSRRKVPQH